jgi:hypothetical protein
MKLIFCYIVPLRMPSTRIYQQGGWPNRTDTALATIVWNGWRQEGPSALPSLATTTALLTHSIAVTAVRLTRAPL